MKTQTQTPTAERPTIGQTLDTLEANLRAEAAAAAKAQADWRRGALARYVELLAAPPADAAELSGLARELEIPIEGVRADADLLRLLKKHRKTFAEQEASRAAVPVARAARDAARRALIEADRELAIADSRVIAASLAGGEIVRLAMRRPAFFQNPAEQNAALVKLVIE